MGKKLLEYVVIVVSFSFIIKLLFLLDLNKRIYNHTAGGCRIVNFIRFERTLATINTNNRYNALGRYCYVPIATPPILSGKKVLQWELRKTRKTNGSAGIEYVKESNLAFITSGCIKNFGYKNIHGNIFLYEFSDKNQHYEARKLDISKPFDRRQFSPFGISSFVSKGRVILYVVNNYHVPSTVEVFQYDPAAIMLRHRKTIRSPMFKNLVDIVVVGADRFIVTSFLYNSYRSLQFLELVLQTPLGSVIYYDGKKSNYIEKYFPTPSGLAIDKKKELLYVASASEEMIRVYRLKKDVTVSHQMDVSLLTSPINIFVDKSDGDLWISAQPVNYKILQHLSYPSDAEYRSPSQVLRVRFQKDHKSWVITEPYANDGATLWGSSSVIFVKDQMLIGSLFGRLLHCNVEYPQLV